VTGFKLMKPRRGAADHALLAQRKLSHFAEETNLRERTNAPA